MSVWHHSNERLQLTKISDLRVTGFSIYMLRIICNRRAWFHSYLERFQSILIILRFTEGHNQIFHLTNQYANNMETAAVDASVMYGEYWEIFTVNTLFSNTLLPCLITVWCSSFYTEAFVDSHVKEKWMDMMCAKWYVLETLYDKINDKHIENIHNESGLKVGQ